MTREFKFETLQLHAGQTVDPTTKSRALPIYQTTSYVFDDTQEGEDLFALRKPGNIYTRITNPTLSAFEERIAALEGGVGALATASGMAALTYTILALAHAGDHVVAAPPSTAVPLICSRKPCLAMALPRLLWISKTWLK